MPPARLIHIFYPRCSFSKFPEFLEHSGLVFVNG